MNLVINHSSTAGSRIVQLIAFHAKKEFWMASKNNQTLPPIPDKRYFSIGETAGLCAVKPHVLRYWEQEFCQLKPAKRSGGRRYYQFKDVHIIRYIRELLYDKGFTISGAKQQLRQTAKGAFADNKPEVKVVDNKNDGEVKNIVSQLIVDLEELLKNLENKG